MLWGTPYERPSQSFSKPPLQSLTPQPSGLDGFLILLNMDDRTCVLRRMYDELKVKHLFILKEANVVFKEEEERLEEIGTFIKEFIDHVLWIKIGGEEGAPWTFDSNDEGTKEQNTNATSQVEDSIPLVPIPTKYVKKRVRFQLPEEPLPNNSTIPPLLIEVNPHLATTLDNVSDDEVDEEIVVESPKMLVDNAHCDISYSSCIVDKVSCTVNTSMYHEHVLFPSSRSDEHIKHDIVENDELCLNAQIVVKCEPDDSSNDHLSDACLHDSSYFSSVSMHDIDFYDTIELDGEFIFPSSLDSSFVCPYEREKT